MGWLSGWQYRRAIVIQENSGSTLTDYQVKIDLTSYDLSVGATDGIDIRVTDSDGETLLDYWRQDFAGNTAGDSKIIWVKVPSIPASSTKTIYLYYGNSSATDASNGDSTFLVFDDFEGTALDTTKWNISIANNATYTVENGLLKITSYSTDWSGVFLYGKQEIPIPCIIEAYTMRDGAYGGGEIGQSIGITEASPAGFGDHYGQPYPAWYGSIYRYDYYSRYNRTFEADSSNTATTITYGTNSSNLNVWVHEKMIATSSSVTTVFQELGESLSITPSNTYTSPVVLLGYGEYGEVHNTYYDWIFVRKYVSSEPTVTVSAEETSNWLSGWSKRRRIVISETGGSSYTDLQVKLDLTDYSLIGSTGSDIRITNRDGTTVLNYWRETFDGADEGDSKILWVKLPSLTADDPLSIYIYYQNLSASDISDVDSVFIRNISGLRLALLMNEGSGTVVNDYSGYGNDGTIYGATWTTGVRNYALEFDGVDDKVTIADNTSLDVDYVTVTLWFKSTTSPQDDYARIFFRTTGIYPPYSFPYDVNGTLPRFLVTLSDGTTKLKAVATSEPSQDWHHLAGKWDGSTVYLYVDNVKIAGDTGSGTLKTDGVVTLGMEDDGDNPFKGIIDEVFVFDHALSDEEIADIYNYAPYATPNYQGHLLLYQDSSYTYTVYDPESGIIFSNLSIQTPTIYRVLSPEYGVIR